MFDLSQEAKPQAVVLFPSGTLIDDEYFSVAILSIYKEYADYADSFFPQIQETVKKKNTDRALPPSCHIRLLCSSLSLSSEAMHKAHF